MASLLAAASSSYISSSKPPIISFNINAKVVTLTLTLTLTVTLQDHLSFRITAQQQEAEVQESQIEAENELPNQQQQQQEKQAKKTVLRTVEPQVHVRSRNMSREYGEQWLSSVTRHVRIYAACIDPETCEMDQTQMDKLTLILHPTDEFVWTDDTSNMVYAYFQGLVEHYEGAPLTGYTLRLIGSDIGHYIRKLLYDGEIKYNMSARVLNFSMRKPRMKFNGSELQGVQYTC